MIGNLPVCLPLFLLPFLYDFEVNFILFIKIFSSQSLKGKGYLEKYNSELSC